MSLVLRHVDILPSGARALLTRTMLTSRRPKALHGHDFYELFWVQNGQVRHHLPEAVETLQEGDLRLLFPGDTHALQGKGEAALVVTVCLHPEDVKALLARHAGLLSQARRPLAATRDIRQLAALNQSALMLERGARDALAVEAFLLPLLADLKRPQVPGEAPDWLAEALVVARDPEVFRIGPSELAARTGRGHAHVSRSFRRYLDMTPSDYLNRMRMDYAARQLVTDSDTLPRIAADCGLPNLSHFHKLFRAHHGMTPRSYRRKFQQQIAQPE